MILSDRSIREEIAAGRIVVDPFDDTCVQPSSIDLHVDREFRVFQNNQHPFVIPASSCWGPRSSGSRYRMIWSRGWKGSRRSAAWVC